ncbi:MAG: hypothetical protein OES13_09125 [Acidimicrobiia bacterium]|nr:hypothetical protein [Acidimicrobiia bacterium]
MALVDSETGFVSLTYPGSAFRPMPRFAFDAPADWVLNEFPGALFIMGPVGGPDEPWSNVVVRHERILPDTSLEAIAKGSWEAFEADNPGAVVIDERLVSFAQVHYVREVDLAPVGDEEPTTRIDSFVFGPEVDYPTLDLFQFTWMHPTTAGPELKPVYVKILSSLNFIDEPVAATP